MKLNKGKKYFLILLTAILILTAIRYALVIRDYKVARYELGFNNWTRTMHPFYSSTDYINFMVTGDSENELKTWWKGLSGKVEFILYDEGNNLLYRSKSDRVKNGLATLF